MQYGKKRVQKIHLKPGQTIDRVRERLGVGEKEKLRTSGRRAEYLRKLAAIMANETVELNIGTSAHVELEHDTPKIEIPGTSSRQPITDYPDKIWDMLRQETLTLHEVGHVLYTNWHSFTHYRGKVDQHLQGHFQQLWNALEDGRIERQLRHEFANVSDDIDTLNANLAENANFGQQIGRQTTAYTFFQATITACMDLAVHDSGTLRTLMDEHDKSHKFAGSDHDREQFVDFLPEIKDAVKDVLTESDSKQANQHIYHFWQKVEAEMRDADVGGQNEESDGEPMEGKPDDGNSNSGTERKNADGLPDEEELDEEFEVTIEGGGSGEGEEEDEEEDDGDAGSGGSGDEEEEEGDEDGEGGDGDESDDEEGDGEDGEGGDEEDGEDDSDTSKGSTEDVDERDEELEERYREEIQREAEEAMDGNSKLDEIEEFQGILDQSGDYQGTLSMRVSDRKPEEGDTARYQEAKRKGRGLSRIFGQKLRNERRSSDQRYQKSGKFDNKRMMSASRGKTRVFTRSSKPEEKEYDCLIALDRSGSMRDIMEPTEEAVGILASALEEIGVDTCIMSLYSNDTQLEKPFGSPLDAEMGNVFTDETNGMTPLTQVMKIARERLDGRQNSPFMIVVTDGYPDNEDTYEEQLGKCNFPVLGVHLRMDVQDDEHPGGSHFHKSCVVNEETELVSKLKQLATGVMF